VLEGLRFIDRSLTTWYAVLLPLVCVTGSNVGPAFHLFKGGPENLFQASSSGYLRFVTLFVWGKTRKRQDNVLEALLQAQIAWDHGWLVIFGLRSRPRRSGGDESGVEAMRGRKPFTAHSWHLARVFWHLCGNLRSVCGPLHAMPCRSRYQKRTWHVFCTSSKKGLENRSSRFESKVSSISFSRGWGAPWSLKSDHHLGFAVHLSRFHNILPILIPHTKITGTCITASHLGPAIHLSRSHNTAHLLTHMLTHMRTHYYTLANTHATITHSHDS